MVKWCSIEPEVFEVLELCYKSWLYLWYAHKCGIIFLVTTGIQKAS